MALVTHNYKFLYADLGCQGRISDGGVWSHCNFAKKLNNRDLNLPTPRILPKPNDPVWHPHMTSEQTTNKKGPFYAQVFKTKHLLKLTFHQI